MLSLEDSDSERFQTAEAGSSADEVDDCLSVVWEVEGLAVAEATGPKTSERPAGAEAPGSDELMESPGPEEEQRKKPVWAWQGRVPWRGVGSRSLTCGDSVQAHIPEVFRDMGRTGEDFGRVRASALQTILRAGGIGRGSVWVRGRTAECHRMPGGP